MEDTWSSDPLLGSSDSDSPLGRIQIIVKPTIKAIVPLTKNGAT